MAKYILRVRARKMRSKGESVRDIAKKLGIAKSTASLWVRDIILSVEQLELLRNKMIKGSELGRQKSAFLQKEARIRKEKKYTRMGQFEFSNLSKREIKIAGLCLYWGEGSKKTRELSWCNSDPKINVFMINWLKSCYGIASDRFKANVDINIIHQNRELIVKKYWSNITGIPLNMFTNTIFKRTKSQKVYENFNDHYGTLRIRVLKPGDLYYKIVGQIEGLRLSRLGSSVG